MTNQQTPVLLVRRLAGEVTLSVSVNGETFEGDYTDTKEGRAQGLSEMAASAGVAVEDCYFTEAEAE